MISTLLAGSAALLAVAVLAWLTEKPGRVVKAMRFACASVLAATILSFSPSFRVWASEEGSYIYHLLIVNGPLTVYTTNTWTSPGSNIVHTGLEVNGGKYTAATAVSLRFLGAMTTAARPVCSGATTIEGNVYYDTTVHSFAFCNGSSYYRMTDLGATYPTVGSVWTEF